MFLTDEHVGVCKKGNFKNIVSLVDNGCDKNQIMCELCYYGHFEIVKYLVEKCGADVRSRNDLAVRWASRHGHLEIVKYLIEKCGAILHLANPKYDRYLIVCEKGGKRCLMAKRIYFWWVRACYNPNTLTGQRSTYKEYLNILI